MKHYLIIDQDKNQKLVSDIKMNNNGVKVWDCTKNKISYHLFVCEETHFLMKRRFPLESSTTNRSIR